MASEKILKQKAEIVDTIKNSVEKSAAVIFFDYRGLTVEEMNVLRSELRKENIEVKVYKNTLTKRALESLKLDLKEALDGPTAIAFSENVVEPAKIISEFAKKHDALNIKVGIIDGEIASLDIIKELASIPSHEGLLTMLAGGMIQFVKDLSVGLNLYAEQLEDGSSKDEPVKADETKEEATEEVVESTEDKPEETTEEVVKEENKEEEK